MGAFIQLPMHVKFTPGVGAVLGELNTNEVPDTCATPMGITLGVDPRTAALATQP